MSFSDCSLCSFFPTSDMLFEEVVCVYESSVYSKKNCRSVDSVQFLMVLGDFFKRGKKVKEMLWPERSVLLTCAPRPMYSTSKKGNRTSCSIHSSRRSPRTGKHRNLPLCKLCAVHWRDYFLPELSADMSFISF